jgi:hypothetical protein
MCHNLSIIGIALIQDSQHNEKLFAVIIAGNGA